MLCGLRTAFTNKCSLLAKSVQGGAGGCLSFTRENARFHAFHLHKPVYDNVKELERNLSIEWISIGADYRHNQGVYFRFQCDNCVLKTYQMRIVPTILL